MIEVETVAKARDNAHNLMPAYRPTDTKSIPSWPFKEMAGFLENFLRDKWEDQTPRIVALRQKLCESASTAFGAIITESNGRERLSDLAKWFRQMFQLAERQLRHVHAFCARFFALLKTADTESLIDLDPVGSVASIST